MNELRTNDLFALDPFDDAFRNFMIPWIARANGNGNARSPQIKIDLSEANGNYKIKADIPGVSKDDIDVKVDDNKVTISAEVKKRKTAGSCARNANTASPAAASGWTHRWTTPRSRRSTRMACWN